jgi:hypothetical protein
VQGRARASHGHGEAVSVEVELWCSSEGLHGAAMVARVGLWAVLTSMIRIEEVPITNAAGCSAPSFGVCLPVGCDALA